MVPLPFRIDRLAKKREKLFAYEKDIADIVRNISDLEKEKNNAELELKKNEHKLTRVQKEKKVWAEQKKLVVFGAVADVRLSQPILN